MYSLSLGRSYILLSDVTWKNTAVYLLGLLLTSFSTGMPMTSSCGIPESREKLDDPIYPSDPIFIITMTSRTQHVNLCAALVCVACRNGDVVGL